MRAVVLDGHGGPEVLAIAQVPDPVPGPGEVQGGFTCAGAGNEPTTSDGNLAALRQICEWLKRAHREENTLEDLIKWLENELRQSVARSS